MERDQQEEARERPGDAEGGLKDASKSMGWDDPRFRRVKLEVEMILPRVVDENGFRQGLLTFYTFTTDVYPADAEDLLENRIGVVGGGVGALVILDKRTEEFWVVRHDEIWRAFCEALGR